MFKKIIFLLFICFVMCCNNKNDSQKEEIVKISLSTRTINNNNLSNYLTSTYKNLYPVNFENVISLRAPKRQLTEIGDLSFLPNLKLFNGGTNDIRTLENINFTTELTSLIFLNNDIEKIEELDALINLETLWFRYNDIKKIEGLNTLVNLKYLDLSYNDIEVIEGLEDLESLERLEISVNKIKDYSGLLVLKKMKGINIIGKNHVQDEKSREILLQVRENNPDADLLGFDWIDEDE